MMPGKKDIGYRESAEFLRARVMRILLLSADGSRKALFMCRNIFAEYTRYLPRHGINEDHRGKLASCENVITNRNFFIDPTSVNHTLIDTFIMTAEQNQPLFFANFSTFACLSFFPRGEK